MLMLADFNSLEGKVISANLCISKQDMAPAFSCPSQWGKRPGQIHRSASTSEPGRIAQIPATLWAPPCCLHGAWMLTILAPRDPREAATDRGLPDRALWSRCKAKAEAPQPKKMWAWLVGCPIIFPATAAARKLSVPQCTACTLSVQLWGSRTTQRWCPAAPELLLEG